MIKELTLEGYGLDFLKEVDKEKNSLANLFFWEETNLLDNLKNIRLFHIRELTFEERERAPRREAFENVISSLRMEGINFIYLILGNERGVSFYFGIVKDELSKAELVININEIGNSLLKPSIQGNFRGSKVEELEGKEKVKEKLSVLRTLAESKRFAILNGVPGINETKDRSNFQGIDRLIDVMLGDNFGLAMIAKPIGKMEFKDIEKQVYDVYNNLNLYVKKSIQYGINSSEGVGTNIGENNSIATGESTSVTTGENTSMTKGKNLSETTGTNISKTLGVSENESISEGTSSNISNSTSTSLNETTGTNESTGKNIGKNSSTTEGVSTTKGENSSYSSSSKGTSSTGTIGTSSGTSESKGSSFSKSTGSSTSESKSYGKNRGTSTSTGSSTSETTGTSTSNTYGTSDSETKGTSTSDTKGTSMTQTKGTSTGTSESKNKGNSLSVSSELINKEVQDWMKYMDEVLFPMLDYGRSKGLFIINTFIFAENKGTLLKLGNTMQSLFSGRTGNKMPLELEILEPEDKRINFLKNFQIPKVENYQIFGEKKGALIVKSSAVTEENIYAGNWYSTNEISLMAGLPQKEVVGLTLNEEVEFGLNCNNSKDSDEIYLGNMVQSGNELENIKISIGKDILNKHVFITGVTGTGKTTTCQKLLLQSDLPFLVIEPAKTEYRILIDEEKTKDILVFTLGKDNVAPFRINPFEFFKHESLTSRVDMIKAAIESAFNMEAAIPQLIESSIYECYKDYGWDIATNRNKKFKDPFAEGVYSFPTLEDLLKKVESEVDKQGFDERLKKDYIGSIKARLQGLLIGSKGLMLNTRRGIDFKKLIERKVVLEIEEIKNGAEKSLIMGFVLVNLVEALKAKYYEDRNFKHITLIEEAHRLLARYMPGDAPTKKQGVEVFSDMLAEVRKYGESLIIVDQIPNKLTPEILKNTNTKIVHKIFAEDDKEAIGNTMALSDDQKRFLSSLATGRAIMFSQGWDKAIQVQIKRDTNTTGDRYVEDFEIRDRIMEFYAENYKSGIYIGTQELTKKPSKEILEEYNELADIIEPYKSLVVKNLKEEEKLERIKEIIEKFGIEITANYLFKYFYELKNQTFELKEIIKNMLRHIKNNEEIMNILEIVKDKEERKKVRTVNKKYHE